MTTARENPFTVERIESLLPFDPSWLKTDWDSLVKKFEEQEFCAAIVGPHGSGKSTFLDSFEFIISEKTGMLIVRLFLNDEKRQLTRQEKMFLTNHPHKAAAVIFLDGAEQLGFFDRLEFTRLIYGFGGILTTQHKKKRKENLLLETETIPAMLRDFVYRLMPDFPKDDNWLDSIFHQADGNIRDALRLIYDDIADQ